ncbi:threonine aldolase family protein [Alienimonas californiensis]|uniref:L-allo-threonine aldolase n=1 Tax=Alienimonas californiensis TaxID=2527989 RepID=A0A517PER3_9PLAN|nr:GntG family PLP-dependent aldolase [Alienimonas californiensis]QDT17869.1 L-allo-threonine aldolase [Alienimonas californiensis]
MPHDVIDLRSDTVTKPTPGMYRAMCEAELGDDMAGEDPTVNALEAEVADLLGKEAALFCLSGTMSNQLGVRCHARPGDEVLIHETGHIANYEGGAAAALSGVTCRLVPGEGGMPGIDDFAPHVRADAVYLSSTAAICLENTTNMAGGRVWPLDRLREVSGWARGRGLKVHLDGARFFNAVVAGGGTPREIADCCDTVSICFSKGLGCPMGSILVGTAADVRGARRARKIVGGACRQAGVIAGTARYALAHHVERLAEDHANASAFWERVSALEGVSGEPPETNLVFFTLAPHLPTPRELCDRLRERGVGMEPAGPGRVRACTHLDVSAEQVRIAADALAEILSA